jgi:hypothetical protein
MEMTGRETGNEYRYGMNGQLKEGEVFEGFMSADYWGYDSRLGRRWERDPISYEWQSPYAAFNNNPIYFADPLGLEGEPKTNKEKQAQQDLRNQVVNLDDGPPAKGTSSTNKLYIVSGTFGQNKYSDAIPLPVLRGPSPSQKQAARIAGFLNAIQSNQTFGIGRKHPAEIYTDPELQSLFYKDKLREIFPVS